MKKSLKQFNFKILKKNEGFADRFMQAVFCKQYYYKCFSYLNI